jgi:hypothetical protein
MTPKPPTWKAPDGSPIACVEKIKVLNENFAELQQLALDALEDAVLMGCSEEQIRQAMIDMVRNLNCSFSSSAPDSGSGTVPW